MLFFKHMIKKGLNIQENRIKYAQYVQNENIVPYAQKNRLRNGKNGNIVKWKNIMLTFVVHIAIITNENSWFF